MPRMPQQNPNISITSATTGDDLRVRLLQKKLEEKLEKIENFLDTKKQDKLIAGDNITIEDNVISCECNKNMPNISNGSENPSGSEDLVPTEDLNQIEMFTYMGVVMPEEDV